MIEIKDLLGVGIVLLLVYKIIILISKWVTEFKWKKQINKEPLYKKISPLERELQKKEQQRIIIESNNLYYSKLFENNEFVNKKTTNLSDFIINENINKYDLHKLAQLNSIKVEMGEGWINLTLDLMKELNKVGWNYKVSSIKEKFGELRFYAETSHEDILQKYTEKSKTICEICGKKGSHFSFNSWDYTRCEKHST